MKNKMHSSSQWVLGVLLCLAPTRVLGQTAPAASAGPMAPPAAQMAPTTTPAMPAASAAAPTTQAPAPVMPMGATAAPPPATGDAALMAPVPTPAEAAPPAAKEPEKPKVNLGVWLRTALKFQNPDQPKKINDQSLNYYVELHANGNIYDHVNYQFNLNVQNQPKDFPGTVHVMDAIAEFDFVDEFHFWAGEMLVPVDRSNFSGPFFTSPWVYPGVFAAGDAGTFIGPAEGPNGRNAGTTVWGEIDKGTFKYYAGVYNLTDPRQSPLYSGRLNLDLIGKESGYYHSSTYYGDKDILAIGVGGQYERRGSVGPVPTVGGVATGPAPTDKWAEFNADILAEFKVGDSVITGEGAYYHFAGQYNPADNNFFVLASLLTPQVGIGKIQPLVRYQWAKENTSNTKMSVFDAHLAYVIKGYALRTLVGFQHTDLDHGIVGNAVLIGAQLMTL